MEQVMLFRTYEVGSRFSVFRFVRHLMPTASNRGVRGNRRTSLPLTPFLPGMIWPKRGGNGVWRWEWLDLPASGPEATDATILAQGQLDWEDL